MQSRGLAEVGALVSRAPEQAGGPVWGIAMYWGTVQISACTEVGGSQVSQLLRERGRHRKTGTLE